MPTGGLPRAAPADQPATTAGRLQTPPSPALDTRLARFAAARHAADTAVGRDTVTGTIAWPATVAAPVPIRPKAARAATATVAMTDTVATVTTEATVVAVVAPHACSSRATCGCWC